MGEVDFVRPIEALIPGARGRVLAVIAATTAELNLRTIARLAGVSPAQASRVLPELVDLGIVERREVPPSSMFRLVSEHVASTLLLDLARAGDRVLTAMGEMAGALPISPVSIVVFGSFARREARAESDIDVVIVRPTDIDEDDDEWSDSVEQWRADVHQMTGNRVEVLEVDEPLARERLASPSDLWADIGRDGQVIHGLDLHQLREAAHA